MTGPAELNNNTNGILSAINKITLMSISFWRCRFFMTKRLRRSGAFSMVQQIVNLCIRRAGHKTRTRPNQGIRAASAQRK